MRRGRGSLSEFYERAKTEARWGGETCEWKADAVGALFVAWVDAAFMTVSFVLFNSRVLTNKHADSKHPLHLLLASHLPHPLPFQILPPFSSTCRTYPFLTSHNSLQSTM